MFYQIVNFSRFQNNCYAQEQRIEKLEYHHTYSTDTLSISFGIYAQNKERFRDSNTWNIDAKNN